MTNVNVQTLIADAVLTGDPEHIVHAMALDPLPVPSAHLNKSATWPAKCSKPRRMAARVRQPKNPPGADDHISPKDLKPVDVPLDPALAIHKRFGQLITQKTT